MNQWKGWWRGAGTIAVGLGLALLLGLAAPAVAQDVTITTPTQFATLPNPFVVNGNLTIANGGSILCNGPSGCDINIVVTGDMLMQAGSLISSSATGAGKAGNITITVGNFPNNPPVGTFTMEPGSQVLANSPSNSAGAIVITSGLKMDVDGLVQSASGLTGTGGVQAPGGGPITLKSGCELTITPDGKVSSEGKDPGADLVHLQGCAVQIDGIVQSIVTDNGGHALPNNPANHCNLDPVTHTPANNYTACVEVWGDTITIGPTGEVSADGVTSQVQNTRAWIDLIATNSIAINGNAVLPFAVHANAGSTEGDFGGLITIIAQTGTLTSTGLAVQANALALAGKGGAVIMRAGGNVVLNDSTVEAHGGTTSANSVGGSIAGRSFNGVLSGGAGSVLTTTSAGSAGTITLQGCGGVGPNDGVNFAGTSTPAATILADACGGQPALPPPFNLQVNCATLQCNGNGDCSKQGVKFHDQNGDGQRQPGEPGLGGWEIRAYSFPGNVLQATTTTAPDGSYQFNFPAVAGTCGTFTFCEVLQPTWTQTFPGAVGGNVVSCSGIDNTVNLGPLGYRETLNAGDHLTDNDFGNAQNNCPEDPKAVCTVTVGPNGSVQNAYDNAKNGDVICLFSNTTENVILGGSATLKITQCTTAKVTAADPSKPVWTISSTGKLTIVGPDAVGGTVGWLFETGNHEAKGLRASGASEFGIQVMSNNNSVAWNSANNNAVGVGVSGSFNTLRGGTVKGNTSDGVQISGNSNTLQGATVQSNLGVGINVSGTSNKLKNDKSNTTGPGGTKENGLAEYCVADDTTQDLGSNKKDNANFIGQIAGSPKRYATGCYE